LKLLQCAKFLCFHTLEIGAKFLKELGDRVKSGKNPCPNNWTATTTSSSGRTCTNPYDNGQWSRGQCNQLTFGDGKIIKQLVHAPFLNVSFMGIIKLVIIIHGQSLQMLE
jgi:hypothetical protein